MPAATAAALPPELPPAYLRSRSDHAVVRDLGWYGFTTGPQDEYMLRELDFWLVFLVNLVHKQLTPFQTRHNLLCLLSELQHSGGVPPP